MQQSTRPLCMAVSAIPKPQTSTNVRCRPHTKLRVQAFTSSATARSMISTGRMPKDIISKLPSQQSMKTQMKKMSKSQITNDFGFLPETFVYGAKSVKYPSIFSRPRTRFRIEMLRFWQAAKGLFSTAFQCKWAVPVHPITRKWSTRPLLLRERGLVARDLHKKFYTALAEGDMNKIPNIVCKGLEESARIQIEQRKAARKPQQTFRIERYSGWNAPSWLAWPLNLLPFQATRVLTDKMGPIPVGKGSWIRQCVVRIKTTQTLDRGTGNGPESKTLMEYVVIQKLAIDGQEQPWRLWGTVYPTDLNQISENYANVKGIFAMEDLPRHGKGESSRHGRWGWDDVNT